MGKKSKGKALQKKSATSSESSDEEDIGTVAGADEAMDVDSKSVSGKKALSLKVDISEAVEMLSEKRFSNREIGLSSLIRHFQSSLESSTDLSIEGYQDTITVQLLRLVRNPYSLQEGKLCTTLINLLGLHLGADEDDFFAAFESPLKNLVTGRGAALEELKAGALTCLTLLAFICGSVDSNYRTWNYCHYLLTGHGNVANVEDSDDSGSDDDDNSDSDDDQDTQKNKRKRCSPVSSALLAAAADGWVLLSTTCATKDVISSCKGRWGNILTPLLELLKSSGNNIDIKVSAGRSIAYIWEVADKVLPGLDAVESGKTICDDADLVDEVLRVVKQICKESAKHISKKDRKEQRAEFREIEDWLLSSEPPAESLRMQGAVIEITSFAEMRVVNALKDALGTGFHSCLRMYPVLQDVLGVDRVTDDMDGAGEDLKVNKGSSVDKKRSNYRKQDRKYREVSMMQYSCGGGGGGGDDYDEEN